MRLGPVLEALTLPARRAPSSHAVCDQCSTTLILPAEWVYLGQRLAILAVQKLAHRLYLSPVRFTHRFVLLCVHAALSDGGSSSRSAAVGAAVGEPSVYPASARSLVTLP